MTKSIVLKSAVLFVEVIALKGDLAMELNEKALHCIARQLQGAYYKNDPHFCCNSSYCKYAQDCIDKHLVYSSKLREQLEHATGVYLGFLIDERYVAERMLDQSYIAITGRQVSRPGNGVPCSLHEAAPSDSENQ